MADTTPGSPNRTVQHRAPLLETPFYELPLGAIIPRGWLRNQLELQADGFTGHLPEHWDDLGPDSGWLGGSGESWERGPYYLDGLVPLAYQLEDETLIAKAKPWIEWTLGSQQPNGQFGPATNDDWWCRMVMVKVLMQYEEAAGDPRVIPFLTRYFHYQADHIASQPLTDWAEARGGENILALQWLYNRTGESWLLDLANVIHEQTIDWTRIFTTFPYWRYQTRFDHRIHVVNVAMGLKEPGLHYLQSGDARHLAAPRKGIEQLMVYHGQLHGMWSGDEWLAGTHPSQGVELCAVVEYMFTLEQLLRISGDAEYGDMLERVTYNALPATIGEDWKSHQYVQQVNQIRCDMTHRNWTENHDDANMFGLEPNFGCCTANMHQGWPKFVKSLWMATKDGGLAALSYAPCDVKAALSSGTIRLEVRGSYPFDDAITIRIAQAPRGATPIQLRIPSWCSTPTIAVNGSSEVADVRCGYITLHRVWSAGDVIQLRLPMSIRVEQRANDAVGILRGPLLYALPLGEHWHRRSGRMPFANWEVFPKTPWNYGIVIDPSNPAQSFTVDTQKTPLQPFTAQSAPVRLRAQAKRLVSWVEEMNSAGTPPFSPVLSDSPPEEVELVPYGSARLRVAELPVCYP